MKWNKQYNELLNLGNSKYDILVYTGGRSSLKTGHSIRAILMECLRSKKRVCFFRETKDSIRESCKAELESIINQDFQHRGFVIGVETIRNTITDSYIFFKGLRDMNENSVQSLKGLATSTDIFYIDEAQAVSERVWNVLIDTLKKANSKLIVNYNRITGRLPVENCLFINYRNKTAPGNTLFKEINYIDIQNKTDFLSPQILNRIETLKNERPKQYEKEYLHKIVDDDSQPFANVEIVNYFEKTGCDAWLDPSSKGRDYTAFCLCKRNFTNMIALGFMFKKSWDECVDEIAEISNLYNVNRIIAETNGVGNIIIKLLSDLGASVRGYNTTLEKTKKILALAVYRDSVKLSNATDIYTEENRIFVDNCVNWTINTRECDDGIDSFASYMYYMGLTYV
ncbi:MAG: phage terminase large subunit [Rickettsiales bacterium]|jgi:hypothetical protein|nr:phage terminase large subunit [Rickettsiales bacterium]